MSRARKRRAIYGGKRQARIILALLMSLTAAAATAAAAAAGAAGDVSKTILQDRDQDRHRQDQDQGPDLQNILRFIVRLS